MTATVRRGAIVALLALSTACGGSQPTPPSPVLPRSIPISPTTVFAPVSEPARIFVFERGLAYPVRDYTEKSRFVLFDSGAFQLEYPGGPYAGSYAEENGVITFKWQGWSSAGPWGATARLEGDSLKVQYNLVMQMTDFEDAVYVRTPSVQ